MSVQFNTIQYSSSAINCYPFEACEKAFIQFSLEAFLLLCPPSIQPCSQNLLTYLSISPPVLKKDLKHFEHNRHRTDLFSNK